MSGRSGRLSLAVIVMALSMALPAGADAAQGALQSLVADVQRRADPPVGPPAPAAVPRAALVPAAPSPWKRLKNAPPFEPGSMLLASDGSVLVHAEGEAPGTGEWWRLSPDQKGSYADGTWSQIASMPKGYTPLYFASAILPDGRMIVEGGEYNGGEEAVWTNLGAIYNPLTNAWKKVAPPAGWTEIGDAASEVLANGTFLLDQAGLDGKQALLNASGLNWLTLPGRGKNDPNDEEGLTLLPSSQLLTVDAWLTPTTELFNPATVSWSPAGNTVGSPVNGPSAEIGPQVGMPGGNVFVVGAGTSPTQAPEPCTTHTRASTSLYDYAARSWVKGPAIPTLEGLQYDSADGPASVLPDGNVLFDVSPCVYSAPLAFYVYEAATRKLAPVPDIANAANDSTYYTRMLALPNGQVLFDDGSARMELYTAGGTPNPAWAPAVTGITSQTLKAGQTAGLSGIQLAGLDQGAAYGDDSQNNTNFPLVRLTYAEGGAVLYARTSNWSSVSVAPGASSSTQFTIPKGAPAGQASLEVVANGIASAPVPVTIR